MRKFVLLTFLLVVANGTSSAQYFTELAFPDISFNRPVDLQSPDDGSNRLFVVEQDGIIRAFDNNSSVSSAPVFLDIDARVNSSGNEEGLLGMAFDPNFADNGYFFVSYTASTPRRSVVSRFSVSASNPSVGDPASELVILEADQPNTNHNGGQIQFGPDGYLYIALGDGGGGGDPDENGQDRGTLLGSILRIDVSNSTTGTRYVIPADNPFVGNSDDYREEIWAWGLRNPWRFSFDASNGTLWTGDVGQGRVEEINIIEKGKNYGWDIMEASLCFEPLNNCDQSGLEVPIWEYVHGDGNVSITGGYAYHGSRLPELAGKYVYADYASGRVWALESANGIAVDNVELVDANFSIASFGEDDANELYLLGFDGKIHQINRDAASTDEPATPQLTVQAYPNPFSETATFAVSGPPSPEVTLAIFDILGRRVTNVKSGSAAAGSFTAKWDGTSDAGVRVPPGLYIYKLELGAHTVTGTVVRL